ncbi:MAG: hypothetical protein RL127_507 [Bacteroidota bacterium]
MEEPIINRVSDRIFFDLAPLLFMGLALKEKEYREFLAGHDWSAYQDKFVAIGCTADAIIPTWAYMLAATYLNPVARGVIFGDLAELEKNLYLTQIESINASEFEDARIVIKGCSKEAVPTEAYVALMQKLQPVAKSIFFGEPCSTVPLFKKSAQPKNNS